MQFNIPLGTTVIDSAAMEARLQAVDPAALVDAEAGVLRVSSSLSEHELASLLTETRRDRRWGTQLVQNKLADSLFTMAVCEYVRRAEHPRGLLAALTDARGAHAGRRTRTPR